jgi:thiol-disulfide isomerase/thioredoxin
MSEVQVGGARKKSTVLWAALTLIAIGAVLYAGVLAFKHGGSGGLKGLAKGEMAKLVIDKPPRPADPIKAEGPDGRSVTLADYKGQVVVVNLWATWCAPCVKEMPTLAKLQAEYAGRPVKVLAISLDKGTEDIAKARAFMADKTPLQFHHGDYSLAFSLNPPAEGLPTTLIFDRQGRERARLAGGADWSTGDAKAVIDRLLRIPIKGA